MINGKEWLLFGPFAGWSPKFLKMGKVTDLPASIKPNNLLSMVGVGLTEFKLATFLLSQLALTPDDRIDMLREFAPKAQRADWELITAGQRVQVIRPAKGKGGALEFGTMVLNSADGSIAGLLGASPGASTAVPAMLDVMQRCFPDRYSNWMPKLKEMIRRSASAFPTNRRYLARYGTGAHGFSAWSSEHRVVLVRGSGHHHALRPVEIAGRSVHRRAELCLPGPRRS